MPAGLVVGIVLGAIALAVLVALLTRHIRVRRQRHKTRVFFLPPPVQTPSMISLPVSTGMRTPLASEALLHADPNPRSSLHSTRSVSFEAESLLQLREPSISAIRVHETPRPIAAPSRVKSYKSAVFVSPGPLRNDPQSVSDISRSMSTMSRGSSMFSRATPLAETPIVEFAMEFHANHAHFQRASMIRKDEDATVVPQPEFVPQPETTNVPYRAEALTVPDFSPIRMPYGPGG